jgi:hypothetical protein
MSAKQAVQQVEGEMDEDEEVVETPVSQQKQPEKPVEVAKPEPVISKTSKPVEELKTAKDIGDFLMDY